MRRKEIVLKQMLMRRKEIVYVYLLSQSDCDFQSINECISSHDKDPWNQILSDGGIVEVAQYEDV